MEQLYFKLQSLYLLFMDKGYFRQKVGITKNFLPETFIHEADIYLPFHPFPIASWSNEDITEDHVFDVLEFLFAYVSKPGQWLDMYQDYEYDEDAGRNEFRETANSFLIDYAPGYEMTADGKVVRLGTDGLQYILNAEIVPYDEENVDRKVRSAINKWRSRHASQEEKREAIRELADVFEWLKKVKGLATVLDGKDESVIFNLANNFGIRHHNPSQKTAYDKDIWFSWIFHFYLATYHASIRLLTKHDKSKAK